MSKVDRIKRATPTAVPLLLYTIGGETFAHFSNFFSTTARGAGLAAYVGATTSATHPAVVPEAEIRALPASSISKRLP